MRQPIHHLYTSPTSQLRGVAEALADNLEKPVVVQDISELPAPDTQRPTRQQLRKERAVLQVELDKAQNLLKLSQPYPRLANEVAELEVEIEKLEARIQEIGQQLTQQEGGQAS